MRFTAAWIIAAISLACPEYCRSQVENEKPALPVFVDGMAQVVEAFAKDRIDHDLWVETEFDSDNNGKPDRMHVSVSRPRQTETEGLKVPVIYGTSPYYSGVAMGGKELFWDPSHEIGETPPQHEHPKPIPHGSSRPLISHELIGDWVPRGFAVVHSSSPGTGLSQGCPTVGGENESLAPKAVIDWLNGRAKGYTTVDGDEEVAAPWCTGKVGMIGTSYNGTLPIAAATTGVEGLEAIIPVAPNTSYYHYYRSHGLVRHPGGYMGEDIDVLYDFINSGDPAMREHCDCEIRDKEMAENMDRLTGDYSDWWAARDYLNKVDKIRAATFMCHGFNDWNVMPEHSFRIYRALRERGVPAMCYYHQAGHGGDPPLDMQNRWFSRYLYGIDNKVEELPRAWIVREGKSMSEPDSYADFPNPDASPVKLWPSVGGNRAGELGMSKPAQSTIEMLVDDVGISGSDLAQATESANRLLYLSPPLKEPLHLSGVTRVRIRVASSKPAANLSIWMVALPWDQGNGKPIYHDIVTRSWADPQNTKSNRESKPLVPGEFVELEFEMQPDDQILPAGQQLGLMIFSSDRDFTLWPDPGTDLSVDLAGTSFDLPVVGGVEAWKRSVGN